jgi:hypothetical protein
LQLTPLLKYLSVLIRAIAMASITSMKNTLQNLGGACEKFRKGDPAPLQKYYDQLIFGVENFAEFIDKLPFEQIRYAQKMEPGIRLEAGFTVLGS